MRVLRVAVLCAAAAVAWADPIIDADVHDVNGTGVTKSSGKHLKVHIEAEPDIIHEREFAKLVPNTTRNDGPGFDHAILDKKITKHFLRHERKASLEPSEDTPEDEKAKQQANDTVEDTPAEEEEPATDEPATDDEKTSFLDEAADDDDDDDDDDDQNASFLDEAENDDDDDDDDDQNASFLDEAENDDDDDDDDDA